MESKKENSKERKAREKKEKAERAAKAGTATPQAATEGKATPVSALPKMPKLPGGKKARKPRPQKPCACGCGTPTTGLWAPGHDARANGWAIRIERELLTMKDVPENEREGAKRMLKERKEKGIQPGAPMRVLKGGKKTEAEKAEAAAEAVNG